ncbi:hypothetical protein FJ208_00395 [Candidatus Gribaldobacteria bacterium]|nr:hypothetical protein [Candidatus Gribaldobacteria bacterium]
MGLFISIRESKKISGVIIEIISDEEMRATLGTSNYKIFFVDKKQIYPFFGEARNEFGNKMALIRKDLPQNVKDFVIRHEIYHLQDEAHKGFIARELYANLAAAYLEPFGFLKTILLTLSDINRIKYYLSRI